MNVRNVRGYSPLMLAASSDTMPAGVVKALLAKGADTTFDGDYGETARDLASKRGDTEVTRLLGGVAPAADRGSDDRIAGHGRRHTASDSRRRCRKALDR